MASQFLVLALAASPLVAAHGKVAVLSSALGGNTTALGIKGGVVPGAGPNSKVLSNGRPQHTTGPGPGH